jgi:hypothetical protein
MSAKLTLSVNPAVVARARRYAHKRGVSISRMVEAYLTSVAELAEPAEAGEASGELPPILRALRGTLQKADLEDYRKHLSGKYR